MNQSCYLLVLSLLIHNTAFANTAFAQFEFDALPIAIKGIVFNEKTNEPVPNLQIEIASHGNSRFTVVDCDDNGSFEFLNNKLTGPTDFIRLITPGFMLATTKHPGNIIDVSKSKDGPYQIYVVSSGYRRIQVLDCDGMPVPYPILESSLTHGAERIGNQNGEILLPNLTKHQQISHLRIYHPTKPHSLAMSKRSIHLGDDVAVELIVANLKPDVTISGTVIGSDMVQIGLRQKCNDGWMLHEGNWLTVYSDVDGRFVASGLPAGCEYQFANCKLEASGDKSNYELEPIRFEQGRKNGRSIYDGPMAVELDCQRWWNSPTLLIADQLDKLVICGQFNRIDSSIMRAMRRLQWIHETYHDQNAVVLAQFSANCSQEALNDLVQANDWTFPIAHSNEEELQYGTLLCRPSLDGLGPAKFASDGTLIFHVRQRVLYPERLVEMK